jgi:hypothetical protein
MPFDASPQEADVGTPVAHMLEILRETIGSPERWAHGQFYTGRGAHCLVGWLDVVLARHMDTIPMGALRSLSNDLNQRLYEALPPNYQGPNREQSLWVYNDSRGHQAVMALIDRAIAAS